MAIFKDKRLIWIGLGVISLLLKQVFAAFPEWTEQLYSRGFFVGFRYLFDYSLALIPIPLFYIFNLGVLYWGITKVIRFFRNPDTLSFPKRLLSAMLTVLALIGGLLFVFYWSWGYNYDRLKVEQQLGLTTVKPSLLDLEEMISVEVELAITSRSLIPGADSAALDKQIQPQSSAVIRPLLTKVLQQHGYPTPGRVKVVQLLPKGILMRFGITGIYFPFVGEGHIDCALHTLDQPFTLAHEMAHGYGFGDEATCNFWAYLACLVSSKPALQYAGHFNYLEYLLSTLRRFDKERYMAVRAQLPKGIHNDLIAKKKHNAQYPDLVPLSMFNDAYLKSQGVKEGVLSYSRVVLLVEAYRK